MREDETESQRRRNTARQARLNAALSVVWNDLNDGERLCLDTLFQIADKTTMDARILDTWEFDFQDMECSMRVMKLLMDIYDATWGEGESTDLGSGGGEPFGVVVSYAAYQIATGDGDRAARPEYAA